MRFGNWNISSMNMSGPSVIFSRELAMLAVDVVALIESKLDKAGNKPQMIILFFIVKKWTQSLTYRNLVPKIMMLVFKIAVAAHRVFY
jgi:hypothetical protein